MSDPDRRRVGLVCPGRGSYTSASLGSLPADHPLVGQVERFNRTIKEATVKQFHYESLEQLQRHLDSFLLAYNHAYKLSAIGRITPWQAILERWSANPKLFRINPNHQLVRLNN